MDAPLSAAGAPSDELLELVQHLRRALSHREEAPSGDWVEEVAGDLRAGRKSGWYYPTATGGGLAFYSARAAEGFGHVHVEGTADLEERAFRLATAMLDGVAPEVRSLDVGFTGLPLEEERRLLGRLSARPGSTVIDRHEMERTLGPPDGAPLGDPPPGVTPIAISDLTLDALADLDRRAFAGTVDELLIGRSMDDNRRVLRAFLAGQMGRFLPEASIALLEPEPPRLTGVILSAEHSPRRAVFLDFMVDPADRGRGHGRYLLRWGLRALWALGYSSVHLWVTTSNVVARRLYDRTGFRQIAAATIYRWDRPGSVPQAHSAR